jgi:hypothetical protein
MLHPLRIEQCLYRSRPAKPSGPDLPSSPHLPSRRGGRRDPLVLVDLALRQFQLALAGLAHRQNQPVLVGLVHQEGRPALVGLRDPGWVARIQRPQAS